MNELLYIDNLDAYKTWGVFISQGGYNSVVSYPKPKSYTTNDWKERDGEEIDNRPFVYESRQVTINFAIVGNEEKYNSFISYIKNSVYHAFNFVQIGLNLNLRYVSCSSFQYGIKVGIFSAVFCDDSNYLTNVGQFTNQSTKYGETTNFVNGIQFKNFGMTLLGGYDTIGKTPSAKSNMSNNYPYQSGTEYGETAVTFTKRQATLKLMIEADSKVAFWNQYKGFFLYLNSLDGSESHLCKWQNLNLGKYPSKYFSVYYIGQNVTDLYVKKNGGIIAVFDLNFIFEEKQDDIVLLTSEDSIVMVTENNFLINL